ncbi:MAG: hypothetical protein V1867_00440 [Candidatus Falkowbacteria bacterium]
MKKTDMETGTTYFLCPDKKCRLFLDIEQTIPCEHSCPHRDKLVKMLICQNCGNIIELPGDHNALCHISHACPDGRNTLNFRMSGRYYLLYKKPK